jgi:hypothetical protein
MSQGQSNIKVFSTFRYTVFFSGEEFSCTLTFKNVADPTSSVPLSPSLGRLERTGASRIANVLYSGAEKMLDSGRSASKGDAGGSAGRGLHGRSMSMAERSGLDRSRSNNSQWIHGRSQSVMLPLSPVSIDPPKSMKEARSEENQEGVLLDRQADMQEPKMGYHL